MLLSSICSIAIVTLLVQCATAAFFAAVIVFNKLNEESDGKSQYYSYKNPLRNVVCKCPGQYHFFISM